MLPSDPLDPNRPSSFILERLRADRYRVAGLHRWPPLQDAPLRIRGIAPEGEAESTADTDAGGLGQ